MQPYLCFLLAPTKACASAQTLQHESYRLTP